MAMPEDQRHLLRFLRIVEKSGRTGVSYRSSVGQVTITSASRDYRFDARLFEDCIRRRYVTQRANRAIISDMGIVKLRDMLHPEAEFTNINSDRKTCVVKVDDRHVPVEINCSESPLVRLFMRRQKDGTRYINEVEFAAGERLRSDFEKGNMQPRVSANWQAAVAGRGRSASGNQSEELSDFALDMRNRVRRAMDAVGPELAGVAIDVCCFLKGLELVEREKSWPPRSAKLMLKTALSALARHYGMGQQATSGEGTIRSWGQQDYRPAITC